MTSYDKKVNLLDIVFPKKCEGCGKMGAYVCRECELGMWEEEQICPICCRPSRYGLRHVYCKQTWSMDGLICFWAYEGVAKKLVKNAKYKYYFDYLKYSSQLTTQFLTRPEFTFFKQFITETSVMVPVPLFEKRLNERGFNQAEIIAKVLGRQWLFSTNNLLARVKDTGRQVGRTREERLMAMEGAFKFKIENLKFKIPEAVVLVDDVWTTGATMRECTRTLKKAGIKQVWGLVLAR
jgi:ComF family protein